MTKRKTEWIMSNGELKLIAEKRNCFVCGEKIIEPWRQKYCKSCWESPQTRVAGPKTIYDDYLKHFIRSKLEKQVFTALKQNDIKYIHESKLEHFGQDDNYILPDATLKNNTIFLEIKGIARDKQTKRMRLFKIKYPNIKIVIISNHFKDDIKNKEFDFADKLFDIGDFTKYIEYLKQEAIK